MGTGIGDKAFGADMKQAAEGKARRREALSRRTEDYATAEEIKRRYAPGMEDNDNPRNLTMQSAEEGFNTNDKEGVKKGGGEIKPPRPGKKFGDGRDVLGTGYPAPYPDAPKPSPASTDSPEDYPMAPTTSFGRPPRFGGMAPREDSPRPPRRSSGRPPRRSFGRPPRRSFGRPPRREDPLRPPGREGPPGRTVLIPRDRRRGRPDRRPPAGIMDTMRRERSAQWQRKLNDMRRQRATDRQRVGSPGREDQPRAPFGVGNYFDKDQFNKLSASTGNPSYEERMNSQGFKDFLQQLADRRGGKK